MIQTWFGLHFGIKLHRPLLVQAAPTITNNKGLNGYDRLNIWNDENALMHISMHQHNKQYCQGNVQFSRT